MSQQGQIVGTVRCAVCGTVERRWIGPADPVQIRVGDEMSVEDELTIDPSASFDDGTFLEPFKCCGRSWVLVTIAGGRLTDLTGVLLADGLERANYCSARVDEEFSESTGERLWLGSTYRSDWLDILRRTLVRRARPLAPSFPRQLPSSRETRFPSGPDGVLADILATPAAKELGLPAGALGLNLPIVAASIDQDDALPDDVLAFRSEEDDADTWVVGRSPQRQHPWPVYRFIAGAWLRSLVRQAAVTRGRSPTVTDVGDDYPCGATLDGGRWTLVASLRGTAERGVFLALERDGRYGIATLTSPQRDPLPVVRERLERRGDQFAEMLWVGSVEGTREPLVAVLEVEPPGESLADAWLPFRQDEVAAIGVDLANALVPAHRMLEATGGLRPETIYVSGNEPRVSSICPRGEAFMAGQAPRSTGSVTPYTYLYDAPEVLRGGGPTPASDVFSVCAVLAHIATAEHPFMGEGAFAQLSSIVAGRRRPFRGPAAIAKIVDRGLVDDSHKRPSAAELAELLSGVSWP